MARESQWYRREIEEAAARHGLDADLVEAIVVHESMGGRADAFRHESEFWARYLATNPKYAAQNPRRVSSSYGLMQVMFSTAVDRGYVGDPEGLFVPTVNLEFGCRELARLMTWANGNVDQALAAYNGGQGNWRGVEPQKYVTKVKAALLQVTHGSR